MPFRELLDRLEAGLSARGSVVALPDGSVDTYHRVFAGRGTPVDSRAAFAELVADTGTSSVRVERLTREPGGQAVNLARQVAALDVPVTLYGHLDDPVFDALGFGMHSMGDPATVEVYDFEDDDLMLSADSEDVATWSLDDLRAVPGAVRDVESATVLCVVNWVSVRGMDAVLRDLASLDVEGTTVVFDPGDLTRCTTEALAALLAALRRLAEVTDVVVSTNAAETASLAAAVGVEPGALGDQLAGLRSHANLTAAVSHGRDRAVADAPGGLVRVPNHDLPHVRRRTGAGDRFGGALAAALAAEWDWTAALALASACASYFVTTARTADAADLASFLRDVPSPEPDGL
jgi:sugar/nucleoside kinase (ribokinase family)